MQSGKKTHLTPCPASATTSVSKQVAQPISKNYNEPSAKSVVDLLFSLHRDENRSGEPRADIASSLLGLVKGMGNGKPDFVGILGKCCISGCDVHCLSPALQVVRHFGEAEEVPYGFRKARIALATTPPSVLGFLVYADKLEALFLDGTIQSWSL